MFSLRGVSLCALKNDPGPAGVVSFQLCECFNLITLTVDVQFIDLRPNSPLRISLHELGVNMVNDPCADDIKTRQEIRAIHLPCFSIGLIQNVSVVEAESGSLASSYQSLEFEIICVGEVYTLCAIKKKRG